MVQVATPITGVMPPELGEAKIREAYPSVAANTAIAAIGQRLTRTILLAPLAWLLMAGVYFGKVLPIFMRRYTVTNRRLMIRKGWKGNAGQEVKLADIDDIRIVADGNTTFFRAATLEILHDGKVVLSMPGVPEPDSFRDAILNARNAWVPGAAKRLAFISAAATK